MRSKKYPVRVWAYGYNSNDKQDIRNTFGVENNFFFLTTVLFKLKRLYGF